MKALLVAKSGGAFFTRAESAKNSSSGEQGETEGIIRHLAQRDDIRLIYFGRAYGEIPCEIFEPDINGFTEYTTVREQETHWAEDVARMKQLLHGDELIGFVMTAGYSPTFSWVNNPNGAQVQAASVRYQGPVLNILEQFEIPRIVVNNDPRTYPKDQEMSCGWKYARPAALLDQCALDTFQVVGGKKYRRRSVWARPESWAYHLRGLPNTEALSCVVIAHAHITDGCKQRHRNSSWANVLGGDLPYGLQVWGNGWKAYESYDPNIMLGTLRPNEVMALLNQTMCCPCVAAAPGFYTGKVYVCEAQGCIPILYGDGNDLYTWDPNGILEPLNSPYRVVKPGDLKRIVDLYRLNENLRIERRKFWSEATKAHWYYLDNVVSDLVQGRDWNSPDWFEEYGGYRLA